MKKTLLVVAVTAILATACSISGDGDTTSFEDTDTAPDGGSNPLEVVELGEIPDGTPATGSGAGGTGGGSAPLPVTQAPSDQDDPPATGTSSDTAAPLDEASNALIVSLAGYRADAKVAEVRALADTAASTAITSRELPSTQTPATGNGVSVLGDPTPAPTTNLEYDCALGGRLRLERTDLEIRQPGNSRDGNVDAFRFDDCRLPDGTAGERVFEGNLVVTNDYETGSRFDTRTVIHEWSGFSLASGGTVRLEIDGSTTVRGVNADRPTATRSVALARYAERDVGGGLVESLEDVSLALQRSREYAYSGYGLSASGTVANRASGGEVIAVDTVSALARRYRDDVDPAEDPDDVPFVGELSLRAEDGRALMLSARDTRTEELFVDLRYTAADGTVRTRENVPFAELTIYGPIGEPARPE